MNGMTHRWLEHEVKILKREYPKKGSNIPELLKYHTKDSIRKRAVRHGIGCTWWYRWSDDEINILMAEYPISATNIPKLLGRHTRKSIKTKAANLGIGFILHRWSDKEISILRDLYPVKGSNIPELLERHTKQSIYRKVSLLNIKYRGYKEKIKKRELKNLYVDKRMSSLEIGRKYQCDSSTIWGLLEGYGIPCRSKMEAIKVSRHYHKQVKVTNELQSAIDGIVLGDGYVGCTSKYTAYISIQQREDRLPWLKQLKTLFEKNGIKGRIRPRRQEKTYINGQLAHFQKRFSLYTYRYTDLFTFRKRWYPNGKKAVPRDIELDDRALAFWYMGDGSISNDDICFATHGFDKEDVEFLIDLLNSKFGYHPRIQKIRENQYVINLYRQKEVLDFLRRTYRYKADCFNYKWEPLAKLSRKYNFPLQLF